MSDAISDSDLPDEMAVATFAARLEAYAETLPERERDVLMAMIYRAMDPLERLRWRDTSALLDPREEALLRAIADETRKG